MQEFIALSHEGKEVFFPEIKGDYISDLIANEGVFYERDVLSFSAILPVPDGVFLDIGSNIGNHALFFAGILNRKTICFDVNKNLDDQINKIIKKNKLNELIEFHSIGCADQKFFVELTFNDANSSMTKIKKYIKTSHSDEYSFMVDKVDNLIKPETHVAFMKIDVVGAEIKVIKGAYETIERCQPVICAELHDFDLVQQFGSELLQHDYKALKILGRSNNWFFVPSSKYILYKSYSDAWFDRLNDSFIMRVPIIQSHISEFSQKQNDIEDAILNLNRINNNNINKNLSSILLENSNNEKFLKQHNELSFEKMETIKSATLKNATQVEGVRAGIDASLTKLDQIESAAIQNTVQIEGVQTKIDVNSIKMAHIQELIASNVAKADAALVLSAQNNALMISKDLKSKRQLGRKISQIHSRHQMLEKALKDDIATARVEMDQMKTRASNWEKEFKKLVDTKSVRFFRKLKFFFTRLGLVTPPIRLDDIRNRINKEYKRESHKAFSENSIESVGANENFEKLGILLDDFELVVIAHLYPGGARQYGGEFIHNRVKAYQAVGVKALVIEVNSSNQTPHVEMVDSITSLRISLPTLPEFTLGLEQSAIPIFTHSPSPELIEFCLENLSSGGQFHWFHGFEVRDIRRLYFNYTTEQMEQSRLAFDKVHAARASAIKRLFEKENANVVFVSDFLKKIAQYDMNVDTEKAKVVHNFIDTEFYHYKSKQPEKAKRILLIRSFGQRNYANDIAMNAIKILSERDGFEDLHFTIRGFGTLFQELTSPITLFENVDIKEGLLNKDEIRNLHADHGIFLAPTRFDTQGVSLGEAMSSGLACITHEVAAIPEFTDSSSVCLIKSESTEEYAEAIWDLAHNQIKLNSLSFAGSQRVRAQCSFSKTILKELELLATMS